MRTTTLLALSASLALGGCDLFGPGFGPPAAMDGDALTGMLEVGDSVAVSVTVTDDEGRAVSGTTVAWTASTGTTVDPTTSETNDRGVATTRWDLGTLAGDHTLAATAGSVETSFRVTTAPAPLDTIILDPAGGTLTALGDTLHLTALGQDRFGNAIGLGYVGWSSSAPAVASVSGGGVVAHAEGPADISARSGVVSTSARVTVDQLLVGVGIDPAGSVLVVGETVRLEGRAVDARGAAMDTALDLTWSSSDEAVATVDADGRVQTVGTGTAVIGATAGSYSGEATLDVRSGPRPAITAIAPALLGAGDTATISGAAFGTEPGRVTVRVGEAMATVLAVTDTLLTARLPGAGSFPCGPTAIRTVDVDVDGLSGSVDHPVAGAPRHALAVGGSVRLLGDDVACNELAEPGSYVLSVFNTATSAQSATAFQLRGSASGGATLADGVRPRIRVAEERPALEPQPDVLAHARLLEENRRLVERLGAPDHRRTAGLQARTLATEVGEIRQFRIPNLDGTNRCTDYITVTARAAYAGEYGIIWEDTVAPLAGTMDDTWRAVGTEYDRVMHPILLQYFGDPLVYDDRLDGNGRFFMLFSETVNDFEWGVAGFVWSGDFYDPGQCAASERGEIFYGRVPTMAGTGYDGNTPKAWAWGMRSTVLHEVKHLTAYANKFDVSPGSPNLEESGLEEATARLAEEFFGRALQGYGPFANVGYQESIWCERRVGENYPDCDRVPNIMGKHYGAINAYLKTPELLSPFGRVDDDDWTFYGSGWQWVRWAIDQSGVAEADFIKALIREPSLTGPANLAARAGRSVPELLADFTLALAMDDHPSGTLPARSQLTMPGWDTRDIFDGLHEDYSDSPVMADTYPTPWPLASRTVPAGDFSLDVPILRGGAASIVELDSLMGAQLLELLSEAGGTAPSSLGLSIVRVR